MELTEAKDSGEGVGGPTVAEKEGGGGEAKKKRKERTSEDG